MKDNYTFEDPSWVTEDGKINEVELASFFLKGYEMSCVDGILFDKDGMITDLHYIEQTNDITLCDYEYPEKDRTDHGYDKAFEL